MRVAPRRRARAAAGAVAAAAAWLAAVAPVAAYIPDASKIAAAVAAQNRDAGRGELIGLHVVLRAGGEVVGRGRLLSDRRGRARLELREEDGSVERHLLRGGRHLAARDGEMLEGARPLVPPLYLLQARSGAALREGLAALGADPDQVVLGHTDLHDCYVLGGRDRRPSPGSRPGDRPPGRDGGEGPSGRPPDAALWADIESYEIVRIDHGGTRFELGPPADLGGALLPSWIAIRTSAGARARLEVRERSPVSAPADSLFSTAWLRAP